MASKTLVNGTVYEVTGGKTLIDGVAYSIKNGKTLVDGTAYEVGFNKFTEIINLGSMSFMYTAMNKVYLATKTVSALPANLTSANAIKIGDEIFPMFSEVTGTGESQQFILQNYEGTGYPKSSGQYMINCTMYSPYIISVNSFTNIKGLEISIGII